MFELEEEKAALVEAFPHHFITQGIFSVPAGEEGDSRITLTLNRIDFLQGDVEQSTAPMAMSCMVQISQRKEDTTEPDFWRDHLMPVVGIFKDLEWEVIGGAELDQREGVNSYEMMLTFQKTP